MPSRAIFQGLKVNSGTFNLFSAGYGLKSGFGFQKDLIGYSKDIAFI
jgi:hypothetical protein